MSRRTLLGATVATGAAAVGTRSAGAQATPQASPDASPAVIASQPAGSFPLTEDTDTLSVLVAGNAFVGDFENNEFTRWYEERTNVHIEWTVLPVEDVQTTLNVRLASGDYPDVLLHTNPSPSVQQVYGTQGTFVPLNELIEQHGVFTRHVFTEYPVAREASTAADGNIYSLPQLNDCYHCSMPIKLWINQQWLDALGLAMPQTTEDYTEVLRAFQDGDPNGNGTTDEFPLTGSPDIGAFNGFFMNAFFPSGIGANLIVLEGQVVPNFTQDGWQQGIVYLSGLYNEGLIDPEAFTRDRDQIRQLSGASGGPEPRIGSVEALWWGAFTTFASGTEGPWQQYTAVPPLQGPEGVRRAAFNPYAASVIGSFIITDRCQNPELAFRWADGLYEIETTLRSIFGVKDADWRWATPDEVGIAGGPAIWARLNPLTNEPTQTQSWNQTGPSFRPNALRLGEAIHPTIPRELQQEVILYTQTKEKYEPYQLPADMVLPPLYFTAEQSQQVAELGTSIMPYVEQVLAQGIRGDIDISTEWENYLATLETMGLSRYVELHQAALNQSARATW
jgi:putative aldouronate transport system substrate-binding protein